MIKICLFFLSLAMAAGVAVPAVAAVGDTVVSAGDLFGVVRPYLEGSVSIVIGGAITWAAAMVRNWTGIQIEARHREALHSAAMTGVTRAIAMLGESLDTLRIDTKSTVVAEAVDWVTASVPDAVGYLGVTPAKIEALVTAKLGELITGVK